MEKGGRKSIPYESIKEKGYQMDSELDYLEIVERVISNEEVKK